MSDGRVCRHSLGLQKKCAKGVLTIRLSPAIGTAVFDLFSVHTQRGCTFITHSPLAECVVSDEVVLDSPRGSVPASHPGRRKHSSPRWSLYRSKYGSTPFEMTQASRLESFRVQRLRRWHRGPPTQLPQSRTLLPDLGTKSPRLTPPSSAASHQSLYLTPLQNFHAVKPRTLGTR